MEPKEKTGSSLTAKQRNCVQRNSLLRHTNQKMSASIENEHSQFAKNMDLEAKKLRQKLTLMMPWGKPNAINDHARSATREEDNLKLPIIITEPKSAPCSPNLSRRRPTFQWDNLSISPPGSEVLRRGSFESPRSSPVIRRKVSRSFSYHGERLDSLVPPISPGTENSNAKLSPLLPRNLKLREKAWHENTLKALLTSESNEPQSPDPTLEDQFKSLGSCRYLRRASDVPDLPANEAPDTT